MDNHVKVHFHLQPDEDDWPPATVESVWAKRSSGENEYVLANVPFFACDATIGDTIRVRQDDGNLWFDKLVQDSPNSLIRIIVEKPENIEEISNHLITLGCETELYRHYNLIAVSIPASVSLSDVQRWLQTQKNAGTLDYEEAILKR